MIHPFDNSIYELDYIQIPDAAISADFSFQIPAFSRWQILSINLTFTSDIIVAARTMFIQTRVAGYKYNRFGSNQSQINSKVANYLCFSGLGGMLYSGSRDVYWVSLPTPYLVDDRCILESEIIDLKLGDQITDIHLTVLKWKNPK